MKQIEGQLSLFSVIWKKYPGCTKGLCSNCGHVVAYYAGGVPDRGKNWVDKPDCLCSKCGAFFTKEDGFVPEGLPLLSGLNDEPINLRKYPQIIEELSKDVFDAFKGFSSSDDSYKVWEHVPNLGKRYEVIFHNVDKVDWDKLEAIKEKYKAAGLEVSVCEFPSLEDGALDMKHYEYMISTMWTTKGHKEVEKLEPNVCRFSEHTCNKEELWKIADTFDDIECPKKCCRACDVKCCGARCNGSSEPESPAEEYYKETGRTDYWQKSEGRPYGFWRDVKCSKAKDCEAFPDGCGGTIEPCRFGGPFKWTENL